MSDRVQRFRITQRDGTVVTGSVVGLGGCLAGRDAYQRLCAAAARASIGRPMRFVSEPEPGHCWVLTQLTAASDGPRVSVDLRGARVERAPVARFQEEIRV